ncbi:Scr1 family TA system antitoxin-like transcriptional regulator [Kitasatospora sp. NPDC004745]|uniref:Scr1 family TA system antitoxin-like transcriptional regulator n=1 Tax=Kitasatospora sp. NPDC004745 TaxID=3364019 RepID=UPI00368DD748
MPDGPAVPAAFDALRIWAAPKLRAGVPFVNGVPLLPLDEAIDRVAAELLELGGPALTSPPLDALADAVTRTAVRLRRADGTDPRATLLDTLTDELLLAEEELHRAEHAQAVDRVRRVCVMVLCVDKIAGSAPPEGGLPAAVVGPAASARPDRPRLRILEPSVPPVAIALSTATPGPPVPEVPWAGPRLGDTVLGAHLRHLRECQDLSWAQVAARMPAAARTDAGTIADLEAGTDALLREAAHRGQLGVFLHAYGAGAIAATDVHQLLADTELAKPGHAIDRGPGRPHRYQILEQRADTVMLLGSVLVPAALRTPAYEAAASLDAPVLRVPRDVPAPRAVPAAAVGCPVCQLYRTDLLALPDVPAAWQQRVNSERAAVLEQRLRHPDAPETTLILSWDILERRHGGATVHADQMLHLADLARTTALRVRILPSDDGFLATHDLALLRTGRETVTAVWGLFDVTYHEGASHRAGMALARSIPPDRSIGLLERAAAGDLPRRWPR